MDASFSPILRVAYQVMAARVAQRTDLDKLEMTIETNGAIGPEEALRESVRILQDQLAVFGAIHLNRARMALSLKTQLTTRHRSIRSCFARLMISNLPFVPPIASS